MTASHGTMVVVNQAPPHRWSGRGHGPRSAYSMSTKQRNAPSANRPGHNHPLAVLERYEVDEVSGCWQWVGAIMHGYGRCSHNGRSAQAHRVLYEHHKGPIPEGLQLDHLCHNRGCVNPDHLEAVTQAENCRRRPGTKLTHEAVAEIREVTDALCEKYGISPGALAHIAQRTRWADEGDAR